jgi:gliding motility-associated-like protein
MYLRTVLFLFLCLVAAGTAFGQSCPQNIGFEDGTLTNWQCYTGTLDQAGTAPINWVATAPVPGTHTVIKNTSPQVLDPYGHFPVNSPNGSNYSLQLGNTQVSGGRSPAYCERVTYDFIVPNNDYTLIYYYAVVLENPTHTPDQQPKFIANVTNMDNPTDQQCGSFSFTSSAGLEGFQKSDVGTDVYYKAWSPLTIRLTGRKGVHFELEFITRDCSKGGHFGYAYVDFNENCASPITGNSYCLGINNGITLTGPAGFQTYQWTDASGNTLGTAPSLKISPIPPDGTQYNLHIVPYTGLGCENTFTTIVNKINELYNLQVKPDTSGCKSTGVDLTQASVTAGSSPGQTFEYFNDPDAQNYLSDPKFVTLSGTYYIRGTNKYGCTATAPITVTLFDGPNITLTQPPTVCAPATVDLTKAVVTNDAGVIFDYYSDIGLTTKVLGPTAVAKSGTYYVRAKSPGVNCISVSQVNVNISDLPVVKNQTLVGCPPLNLNSAIVFADNAGVTYNFFADAAGTIPIADPTKISVSGTYYYQGVNSYGCTGNIASIVVNAYPVPFFTVTDPAPVVFPATINLENTFIPVAGATFTYWKDSTTTKPLDYYLNVGISATYYIKAVNATGCTQVNVVHTKVNPPPLPDLIVSNTFTPNGDGINDEFTPTVQGVVQLNYIKIFNRYGQQIFETKDLQNHWNGTMNGKPEPTGTYYWLFSCYDIYRKQIVTKAGSVTIIR